MISNTTPPPHLLANRSRPDARAVLADWLEERGLPPEAWLLRVAQVSTQHVNTDVSVAFDTATGDGAADAVAAGPLDRDAANADGIATDATSDGAADADSLDGVNDANADDAANDGATTAIEQVLYWRESELQEGLLLIKVPGHYWPVTRVGWAHRVVDDEWEFIGVTVTSTGGTRTLPDLAVNGPGSDHQVSQPDKLPELLHRFTPQRVLAASSAWSKYVPKPDGW